MEVKTSIRRGGNRMNNDLKHHGVKGMKWGVRRFQNKNGSLKPAGKKREKTSLMKKYEKSLDKANAKSAAGTAKRKAAVKAVPKKYMEAVKKHESKPKDGIAYKLPNAAVGMAATIAINSVIAGPAAMAGRQFLGGGTGAVLGVLAANAASAKAGMKIYDQLMDNGNKE